MIIALEWCRKTENVIDVAWGNKELEKIVSFL